MKNNIFDIANPQALFCTVWRYHVSHSMLWIRVDAGKLHNDVVYLYFELVQYFEGPLRWNGANFSIGSSVECLKILKGTGYAKLPEDELLKTFRLFTVKLPDSRKVKIVAARNAGKSNEPLK